MGRGHYPDRIPDGRVSLRSRRASFSGVTGSSAIAASAFGSAHGFFHSRGFTIGAGLALLTVAVFWLGLAYWVFRDARRRIDDPWLVGTATLLGLVPFLGALVYLLFRPPETLADARAREVEIRALEARLELRAPQCPVCRTAVEASYLICPVCTTQLKQPCASCSAPLDRLWQACPYCATPVAGRHAKPGLDSALTAEAILKSPAARKRLRPKERRAAAG